MLASNSRRIIRNTGMLYMRMLLAMVVGLYTSRVVLDVLGVNDFGTYHVVAGFVTLLGFMLGALATATQRYLAFDLGENGGSNLRSLFNTSLQVHALVAVCIVLVAETAGYWFVSTKLNIPTDRLEAALTAYHLSVAAFSISVMTVPLTAILMAHERMGLFAMMSIADVLLKLVVVLLLSYLTYDKLSSYAGLLLLVTVITFSGYLAINRAVFPVVRVQWGWDRQRFRNMLGFTAWNTWGNLAAALSEHGNNVLLNMFFGPAVNAGRSVASQANGALNNFVVNVQAAVNPQIVKLYAEGNQAGMRKLVLGAAKYNFYILLTLALPVILNAGALLNLWLVNVPPYAELFVQLTVIASLINSISGPLMTSAQATGNIRLYHAVVGGILLLNMPISYAFLSKGNSPGAILVVNIGLCLVALVARLMIIAPLINLSIRSFVSTVIARVIMVSVVAAICAFAVRSSIAGQLFFINLAAPVVLALMSIWLFGLEKTERKDLISLLKSFSIRSS